MSRKENLALPLKIRDVVNRLFITLSSLRCGSGRDRRPISFRGRAAASKNSRHLPESFHLHAACCSAHEIFGFRIPEGARKSFSIATCLAGAAVSENDRRFPRLQGSGNAGGRFEEPRGRPGGPGKAVIPKTVPKVR